MLELNHFYNLDCMEGMKSFPDKFFDLAIVDPPYGININNNMGRRKGDKPSDYKKVFWDNEPPDKKYFDELFRISKNQVIWGANYFPNMPPTKCFLVWVKPQMSEDVSFSMAEYAWTSFDISAKVFTFCQNNLKRIHPTQKPVELYEWVLSKFAKAGDKILDTHAGSASSLIACHNLGYEYIGFEIDPDYYLVALQRLESYKSQLKLPLI